jgi:YspA, cpYpsA-related SLOG family
MAKCVLVCGGRDFSNGLLLVETLNALQMSDDVSVVIHGGAPGADSIAGLYALGRDIPIEVYHAEWKRYGKHAGPIRNQRMLDEGKSDVVVAFPTEKSRGTWDMVRRSKDAGVGTHVVGHESVKHQLMLFAEGVE